MSATTDYYWGKPWPKRMSPRKTDKGSMNPALSFNDELDESDLSWDDLRKHLGWSEARIKAFMNRKENPNAYYYRFNAPGEEQRTGDWSDAEERVFFNKIRRGIDYRWGLFSVDIKGRVGYQCSNHYRKLVSEGRINDPNYRVGAAGKLTFSGCTDGLVFPEIVSQHDFERLQNEVDTRIVNEKKVTRSQGKQRQAEQEDDLKTSHRPLPIRSNETMSEKNKPKVVAHSTPQAAVTPKRRQVVPKKEEPSKIQARNQVSNVPTEKSEDHGVTLTRSTKRQRR